MYLLVALLGLVCGQVMQLDPNNFEDKLHGSEWLAVYFYSPSCGYCKEFSPVFNKVANHFQNKVEFGKLDGSLYSEFGARYKITHFPTIMLFHNGTDLPIAYFGERRVEEFREWIKEQLKFVVPKLMQHNNWTVIYHGEENSTGYKLVKVLALRDKYTPFAWTPLKKKTTPYISFGAWQSTELDRNVEAELTKLKAHLYDLDDESWSKIYRKKMDGVVFVNQNNDMAILDHLDSVAHDNPDIVFLHVEPAHDQFKEVRKHFGVVEEPCLMAVRPSKGIIYRLESPVTPKRIEAFLKTFREETGTQYKKTEHSKNPSMLTVQNAHLLEEMPKDILLFLYEQDRDYTKNLFGLVKHMIKLLAVHPNLHVFACNLSRNDLILEVPMEPLPKVFYMRHLQKKSPVQFPYGLISQENLFKFIKENTVFDWPEELQQL